MYDWTLRKEDVLDGNLEATFLLRDDGDLLTTLLEASNRGIQRDRVIARAIFDGQFK